MNLHFADTPNWNALLDSAYVKSNTLILDASPDMVHTDCGGLLSYLATPYSLNAVDDNGEWCEYQSDMHTLAASRWVRWLYQSGVVTVSPIIQSSAIVKSDDLGRIDPLDAGFWERHCTLLLANCQRVIVPPMYGWKHSYGVWAEVNAALSRNCKVYLLDHASEWGEQ